MSTVPYLLHVPFTGTRSGAFPLTWGQHWVWESVASRAPYYADLSGSSTVTVPDGRVMSDVTEALGALLGRYETFRSTYSVTPDGVPHQVVLADGHLRVDVRDVDATDVDAAAAAVRQEFNDLPFTLPELAFRATVIASHGTPRLVVVSTFHMAIDCHGMVAVLDDFRSLLSGRTVDALDPPAGGMSHPVDRALEEEAGTGMQRSARGVRYWEKELAKFPDDPLPYTGRRPENPRYKTFAVHSGALRAASLHLAEELGVTSSSVILAVVAALLGRRVRSTTTGIVLAASHRYDLDAMRYAGTLVQGVPVAVDVAETSAPRLIARCHRAAMLAALAGHCHPDELARMVNLSYGPAARARLACVVNLNLPAAAGTADEESTRTTRAEADALLAESRFEYVEGTPLESERFYLAAQGDATNFYLTLRADTAVLTSAEIQQFLADLELSVLDCLPPLDEG